MSITGLWTSRHSQHLTTQFLQSMQCIFTTWPVVPTPWGTGGHVPPPILQMSGHGGHHEFKNSKHETDQTVLTITKALTKTTNCTFRANKNIFRCPPLLHQTGAPFRRHWTWLQKFTYIFKCLSFLDQLNIHPYWILAPYFCVEWRGGTNCGNTVLPLQLSHYVTATNQKPANPIHQHVQHRSKESRNSNVWTVCVSIRLPACWHTCFQQRIPFECKPRDKAVASSGLRRFSFRWSVKYFLHSLCTYTTEGEDNKHPCNWVSEWVEFNAPLDTI